MWAMPSAIITVRVQPRARVDQVVTVRNGVLVVRVTAPPLDGRANEAVCRLLATALAVRSSNLRIIRGERAREKSVAVEGLDQADVDAYLASITQAG